MNAKVNALICHPFPLRDLWLPEYLQRNIHFRPAGLAAGNFCEIILADLTFTPLNQTIKKPKSPGFPS